MSKFRYYITDTFDGTVNGTNAEDVAKSLSSADEYFVVDTQTGMWLLSDGTQEEITEVLSFPLNPEG